nr:hypothetical protein Iba_chr15bCG1770 [Ipomoea batatas]
MDNARLEGTHNNFLVPFHIRKQIQFKRECYMLVNLLDKRAIIFESLQMKGSSILSTFVKESKARERLSTSSISKLSNWCFLLLFPLSLARNKFGFESHLHLLLYIRPTRKGSERWGSRPPYNLGSVCPNSLPKLHPDQDEYLEELRTAGSESEPKSSITSLKSPSPFPIPVDSGEESVKPDMLPGNPSPVCGESGELRENEIREKGGKNLKSIQRHRRRRLHRTTSRAGSRPVALHPADDEYDSPGATAQPPPPDDSPAGSRLQSRNPAPPSPQPTSADKYDSPGATAQPPPADDSPARRQPPPIPQPSASHCSHWSFYMVPIVL